MHIFYPFMKKQLQAKRNGTKARLGRGANWGGRARAFACAIALLGAPLESTWASSSVSNPETRFISLEADALQYQVGDRAVVLATVEYPSTNPSQEIVVRYQLEGEEVDFVRVSGQQFLAFPRLSSTGSKNLVVQVFTQNGYSVESKEEKISVIDLDLNFFQQRKRVEKDPETLRRIEAKIQQLEFQRDAIVQSIQNERALLEVQLLPLEVTNADNFLLARSLPSSIFQLWPESTTYSVGQRAKFISQLETEFYQPEGPYELVWRASFLGNSLLSKRVGDTFEFLSSPLSSFDVGNQTFDLRLDLRLKKQGDFLRSSLTQIQRRIRTFEERKKVENRKTFWDWKIAQLQEGKVFLNDRFQATLPVASQSVSITVVPGAL